MPKLIIRADANRFFFFKALKKNFFKKQTSSPCKKVIQFRSCSRLKALFTLAASVRSPVTVKDVDLSLAVRDNRQTSGVRCHHQVFIVFIEFRHDGMIKA